jgi:hypothetical protein
MQVKMLRGIAVGASAVLGLALITPSAGAQAQTSGMRFGVEGAFGTKSIGVGAGAFLKYHLADISAHPITGRVAFDYFFPSSSNFGGYSYKYWELAADGLFDIATEKSDIKPYVGAGLTYGNSSWGAGYCGAIIGCSTSASSTNLHLVGGINFMGNSKLMPFAEVKVNTASGAALIFKGGIHIK